MGYTINLIQDVATGGIWTGDRFREILTQDDYTYALFIEGDPESIPNNFAGLKPGEYRIMTFLTQDGFPKVNNQPFFNIASQPVANTVDVTFTGNGGEVILDPSSEFDAVAQFQVAMYLIFTSQQFFENFLAASPFVFEGYPEYAGTYIMEVFYNERRGRYEASGFSYLGQAGPISAQYLFFY